MVYSEICGKVQARLGEGAVGWRWECGWGVVWCGQPTAECAACQIILRQIFAKNNPALHI
jgi:hypothetical protein